MKLYTENQIMDWIFDQNLVMTGVKIVRNSPQNTLVLKKLIKS